MDDDTLKTLMEQAQHMQEQVAEAQKAQAEVLLTGVAGGGDRVKVTVTGAGDFVSVSISPLVIDPQEPGLLESLILEALKMATSKINDLQDEAIAAMDMPEFDGLDGLS